MKTTTAVGARADGPINGPLRVTFGAAWLVDLAATVGVFLVPYATELNPLTTLLYHAVGIPGVLLAGSLYAGVVAAAGHLLSKPLDGLFLAGVTAAYAICAANNVVLLVSGTPVVETLVF